MSSSVDEDLNWLATQYVLGELSASDRSSFEERMGQDMSACEAVLEASRMILVARASLESAPPAASSELEKVAIAPPTETVIGKSPVAREIKGAWLAVLLSSAAMLMLSVLAVRTSRPVLLQSAAQKASAVELVSLWRTGMKVDDVADDLDDQVDVASDVVVPGWMLAAVSYERQGAIDKTSDGVQEN